MSTGATCSHAGMRSRTRARRARNIADATSARSRSARRTSGLTKRGDPHRDRLRIIPARQSQRPSTRGHRWQPEAVQASVPASTRHHQARTAPRAVCRVRGHRTRQGVDRARMAPHRRAPYETARSAARAARGVAPVRTRGRETRRGCSSGRVAGRRRPGHQHHELSQDRSVRPVGVRRRRA